jgi:hypothetical protein
VLRDPNSSEFKNAKARKSAQERPVTAQTGFNRDTYSIRSKHFGNGSRLSGKRRQSALLISIHMPFAILGET